MHFIRFVRHRDDEKCEEIRKETATRTLLNDTIETYVFIQKLIFVNYSRHSLARHRVELRSSFFHETSSAQPQRKREREILQIPFCCSCAMCTSIHGILFVYSDSLFTFLFCFYVCFLFFLWLHCVQRSLRSFPFPHAFQLRSTKSQSHAPCNVTHAAHTQNTHIGVERCCFLFVFHFVGHNI